MAIWTDRGNSFTREATARAKLRKLERQHPHVRYRLRDTGDYFRPWHIEILVSTPYMPDSQRDRSTLLAEIGATAWYFLRLECGEIGGGDTLDWNEWLHEVAA